MAAWPGEGSGYDAGVASMQAGARQQLLLSQAAAAAAAAIRVAVLARQKSMPSVRKLGCAGQSGQAWRRPCAWGGSQSVRTSRATHDCCELARRYSRIRAVCSGPSSFGRDSEALLLGIARVSPLLPC